MLAHLWQQTDYLGYKEESSLELLKELERLAAETPDNLTGFLERFALFNQEEAKGRTGLSLMTLHAAKGLEFPLVVIYGFQAGLLPYYRQRSGRGTAAGFCRYEPGQAAALSKLVDRSRPASRTRAKSLFGAVADRSASNLPVVRLRLTTMGLWTQAWS